MGRRETMLEGLDVGRLVGVEVGPLDRPLVHKRDGHVLYVDHCDTETLKARWRSDPKVDTRELQVDAVWREGSLRTALAAVPGQEDWTGVDYVVASHVAEHVPDLISWLREIREVLKPTGSLRLALPDRRYTFDYLRRTTGLPEVADAFVRRRRVPSGARILDFTLNMVTVDIGKAWRSELVEHELEHVYTRQGALALARDAEINGTYHDVHCWVFTPASFVDLMIELARTELLEFKCDWLVPTERYTFEFFVSMSPCDNYLEAARTWAEASAILKPTRPEALAIPFA